MRKLPNRSASVNRTQGALLPYQNGHSLNTDPILEYLRNLQDRICDEIGTIESTRDDLFREDVWTREEGGGGRSRVLEGGRVIEKGGVNFSHVMGQQLPVTASARRPELAGRSFEAMGVSVIFHPHNPYAPTSHANVRFFVARDPDGKKPPVWWFGGGFDMTPYYGFEADAIHWHQTAHAACEPFGADLYPRYKQWCDEYFYLKHRNEPRGIGGLFFDDLREPDFDRAFAFTRSVGDHYMRAYAPILRHRCDMLYTERERDFQLVRRGRYVEFNLVYDRGTLFGLQSRGRTESILVSMPPEVRWRYDWQPSAGTEEARLYEDFLRPRDWLAEAARPGDDA